MAIRFGRVMAAMLVLGWLGGAARAQSVPGRGAAPAGETGRVALVIGNGRYPDSDVPLVTPPEDARAMAEELGRLGFAVKSGDNLSKAALIDLTERFLADVKPGATAVVFFAGYAIQSGRQNYLMPVDGQIWTEADVQRNGVAVARILSELAGRGAARTFLVLDAGYRNPFERRFRSFSTGLAPVAGLPGDVTAVFSASPGVVLRGGAGPGSLFGGELVRQLAAAGAVSREVFERTRGTVATGSNNEQTPWVYSSLPQPAVVAATVPVPASPPPPVPTLATPMPEPPRPAARAEPRPAAPPRPEAPRPEPPRTEVARAEPPPVAPGRVEPAVPAPRRPLPYSPDDDRLVVDLTAAIARTPAEAAPYFARGQIYALHHEFERALADFDQVVRLGPRDADALNNRCWTRAILDQVDGALADCNASLGVRPNFLDALDSRGFVYLKIGLPRRAVSDYDAALKVNGRHPSALYGRGLALRKLGDAARGEGDIRAALAVEPNIARDFATYGLR